MVTAVIVAAGRGTRMGSQVDKLFLELGGRPVVHHTWLRFDTCPAIGHVVVVTRPDLREAFERITRAQSFSKPYCIIEGGPERQDSVWNGLTAVPAETEIVAIQDGARPCTAHDLIVRTIAAAREHGAAVAASPVTDTIKESRDGKIIHRHLQRDRLWAVQTPQTFRLEIIRKAIRAARESGEAFTDDTAACEAVGQPVYLVVGSEPNPKVTLPSDLPMVELYLRRSNH